MRSLDIYNIDICQMIESRRHIKIDIIGDSVSYGLNYCNNDYWIEVQSGYQRKMDMV